MARFVHLGAVLIYVSLCHTSAQKSVGTVVVDDGRIGIGLIAGGNFGPGSFSIGGSTSGRPQASVYVNKDDKDGQQIIAQTATHHKAQQENYQPPQSGGNIGNTQLYPVKPLTAHFSSGPGGNGGNGQILIGAVVLNNNKHNKGNKKRNGNKQPVVPDAAALEAISGNNGENNEFPNAGNGFSNNGEQQQQGSIQIGSIIGGNFEDGTYNINNNKKLGTNVPQKGIKAVNNGNTGNSNAGNEAEYLKGHGAHHNSAGNVGGGSSHGQTNPGYGTGSSEEPWIWDR